jgi:AcrR family transcriptional regulator
MTGTVKPPRRYDASRRQAQARETRLRVLQSARELFVERGYAGTSMSDVAGAAGVAVQTVYTLVGGKAALLKTVVDVGIVGDDEPVAVRDRPHIAKLLAEPDGRRKLLMHAEFLAGVLDRIGPLEEVLRAATDVDPDAAAVLHALTAGRLEGMTEFATHLKRCGLLRRGVTVRRAAEVLSTHMDGSIHAMLVRDLGWSRRDYVRWYVTVTAAMLFDPE